MIFLLMLIGDIHWLIFVEQEDVEDLAEKA
jgi:hypothetical protein